jgi:hypothetical protein
MSLFSPLLRFFVPAIQPSAMAEEKRQIFLEAFRSLGLPVIWKWDAEVEMAEKINNACEILFASYHT